ncbi:MAG: DUF1007 family protein [Sulfurimonas sp.]|nr:DUF1007 family protein [Sulfurimonas sp.]
MKKFILFYLFLFHTLLYACATCQLMIPTAEVSMEFQVEKKTLQNIEMQWHFSDLYTEEMVLQYDKNRNNILDPKELRIIRDHMLEYLIPKEMLTKITYADDNETQLIKPEYKNFDLKVLKGFLVFSYDAPMDLPIEDKSILSFSFEDDESFFSFIVSSLHVSESELFYDQNIYLFTASLFLSHHALAKKEEPIAQPKEPIKTIQPEVAKESEKSLLQSSIEKMKSLFESIKDEKNPLSYLLLLFFAYLYGVIHALGPGHGKTLVGSYFLSNERSYSKALYISLAIGVVHTFSAFFLTLIIYFVLNIFLAQFLNDTIFYTTKISALIIIAIALYLLYTKYKIYKKADKKSPYSFSATPHVNSCACASCKVDNNSTDIALIISAGIIPCPGTVTIFIFSLSLGLYYAGFLSALVMSLGMSTIIFFSALLSVVIRKKTTNASTKLKKYLEYGSLIIILLLGFFLLFV